jgi:hypothetical protein
MRKFEAFLTNNGNIAVAVKEFRVEDRHSEIVYCAFITPKGEWLRECSYEEFANITHNAMFAVNDAYFMTKSFDTIMPEKAPVWKFVGRVRIEEDYSSYKPETCNNGGDYAFYTSLDVYYATINDKVVIRGVTRYSTSAEFDYDELNASFQQNLTDCQVLNAEQLRYYTQGYDTTFLEQISQVYKLENIYNLTCKVIEKDDDYNIQEREYIPEILDDDVATLITAGAAFAPVPRNQRRG